MEIRMVLLSRPQLSFSKSMPLISLPLLYFNTLISLYPNFLSSLSDPQFQTAISEPHSNLPREIPLPSPGLSHLPLPSTTRRRRLSI
ncbi:hypothetical protein I3842_12G007100 [Carya illinoinensis]|uniref:Uncharacterized protein n=1 Tax=Carya illinoinensis TaxID=32201 RepID=A0A922DF98_CARIL|nr:hypothetical protein I3842_12G007100 [Carya illinoinensis]